MQEPSVLVLKQTDDRFVLLYAIAITFVVAGHLGGGGFSMLYEWFPLYSFHLSLFMFASGYFFSQTKNPGQYIWKKFKVHILRLYLWNGIYGIISTILRLYFNFSIGARISVYNLVVAPMTNGHQFGYNLPGWFVAPLFMIQSWNAVIHSIPCSQVISNYCVPPLHCVLGLLGVWWGATGCIRDSKLMLVRFLYYLPFFELGKLYRRYETKLNRIPTNVYLAVVFLAQYCVLLRYKVIPTYATSTCRDYRRSQLFLPYIVGIIGLAFWFRIASVFAPLLAKDRIIITISRNTFPIMLHHYLAVLISNFPFICLERVVRLHPGFDWNKFRGTRMYHYLPFNLPHLKVAYLIAGIYMPIQLQKIVDGIGRRVKRTIVGMYSGYCSMILR